MTTVVTGGARGIGAAICRRLAAAGHQVIVLDREAPEETLPHEQFVAIDLTDRDLLVAEAAALAESYAITGIVHNASVIRPALLPEVKLEDFDYLAGLHIGAAMILAQAALPAMKASGFGRIVNISSRAALGLATRSSYSATKAALLGMTRTWALELAPLGITANAIAPGPVETDQFHELIPADSPKKAQVASAVPVGRLGTPEDIAHAVAFLMAEESGFITGQTLYVCGGTSVGSLTL